MLKFAAILIVATIAAFMVNGVVYAQSSKNTPRLILQITVDQLRGDLPTRYYDRLGEGGFKFLWESGGQAPTRLPMAWLEISGLTASRGRSLTTLKTQTTAY
jgi:hypothetical protein